MAETLNTNNFLKPVCLHYMLEKFWEINVDPITYTSKIRHGDLTSTGHENAQTIQINEQPHASLSEAVRYAEAQYRSRISSGYKNFNKPTFPAAQMTNLQSNPSFSNLDSSMSMSTYSKTNGNKRITNEILPRDDTKFVKRSYGIDDGELDLNDPAQAVDDGQGGLFGNIFKKILPAGQKKDIKPNAKKIISVSQQILSNMSEIDQKCADLNIRYNIYERAILVSGEPDKVQMIEGFIKEKENIYKASSDQNDNSNVKREILLSVYLKNMEDQITKKANELSVFSTFDGQKLTILGSQEAVTELLTFLVELEALPARERFDKKDFEEFTMKGEEMNKSFNEMLTEIRKKVDNMELKLKVSSEETTQAENKLMNAMNESLNDIKSKIEVLEHKRDAKESNSNESSQDEKRKNESLTSYLVEIKKKIDSLDLKVSNRSAGVQQNAGQNDPEMLQVLSDHLTEIKKRVGDLEVKMELDTDGIMDEEIKLQKVFTDGVGMLTKKIDAIDMKIDLNSGDSVQKEMRMQNINDTLENLIKKIGSVEQKVDNQSKKTSGDDIGKKFVELMDFLHHRLGAQGTAIPSIPAIPVSTTLASQPDSDQPTQTLEIQSVKPQEETKVEPVKQAAVQNNDQDDFSQKEISISVFHRGLQREIEKKAEELTVFCEFGYDIILTTGPLKNIEKLVVYLQECELKLKKSLYPRYWDSLEIRQFALLNLSPATEEFKEVSRLFNNGMHYRPIIKIERIQNKYLMDNFITNVQKRKEFRNNNHLQRMLLFHGTGIRNPEVIYKHSDVGFDIQFSETRNNARGLYFSTTWAPPNFTSTQNAYRTPTGTFQVLIADVLVGNSMPGHGLNSTCVKAPEGYDSVSFNGTNYVIFNNFHSYPLYVIEYS